MYIELHPTQTQFRLNHQVNWCFPEKFDLCLTDFGRFGKRKKFTQITKILKTQNILQSISGLGSRCFFLIYCGVKKFWKEGVISKRVGERMYMLKGKKYEHQKHINQLRPRYTEDFIEDQEVPMEVLYNMFDIPTSPIPMFESRTSKRKRKRVEPFRVDPKRKSYLLISEGNLAQGCFGGKPVSPVVLQCVIPMRICIVNKLRSAEPDLDGHCLSNTTWLLFCIWFIST